MSTDIYLIYQLDAGLINQQNSDERFEVSKCVLGYFDGAETEVIEYCKTVENSISNRYQVKEDNEHIWYPIIGYDKSPKLNMNVRKEEMLMMNIELKLTLEDFGVNGIEERVSLIKDIESNFLPRKDEKILDNALSEKGLLIKEVTWDFERNKCILDVSASEIVVDKDMERYKKQFSDNGWTEI